MEIVKAKILTLTLQTMLDIFSDKRDEVDLLVFLKNTLKKMKTISLIINIVNNAMIVMTNRRETIIREAIIKTTHTYKDQDHS